MTKRSSLTTTYATLDLLCSESSDSSDSTHTISSEFSSSSSSSSSRTSTIKKQKRQRQHQHQQQHRHHSNRNNGFIFCGPNENGGFIAATTPKRQSRTERIDNTPIHNSTRRSIIEFNFNDEYTNNNGDGIPERLMVPVI